MKRKEMVKSKEKFNLIIKNNQTFKSNYFIIYMQKSDNERSKFGLAVGKALGNAVARNRLKRIYRSVLDQTKFMFPNYSDYIIMVRKPSLLASFEDIRKDMKNLLNERVKK